MKCEQMRLFPLDVLGGGLPGWIPGVREGVAAAATEPSMERFNVTAGKGPASARQAVGSALHRRPAAGSGGGKSRRGRSHERGSTTGSGGGGQDAPASTASG